MPPASRTKSYCIASPLQKRRKTVKRRADVIEERRASREELANSRRQPPGRSRRNPALFSAVHPALFSAVHPTRNHAASAVITAVNTSCAWSENTETAVEERSSGAVRWSVHSCDRVESRRALVSAARNSIGARRSGFNNTPASNDSRALASGARKRQKVTWEARKKIVGTLRGKEGQRARTRGEEI